MFKIKLKQDIVPHRYMRMAQLFTTVQDMKNWFAGRQYNPNNYYIVSLRKDAYHGVYEVSGFDTLTSFDRNEQYAYMTYDSLKVHESPITIRYVAWAVSMNDFELVN